MPGAVTVGFYGKLPSRGDFVRSGLPRDFTDRWDDWLQSVMSGSRTLMGDAWLPAFLEAPVWRFALPRGLCGRRAVLGVMLPSVDKAGRYFPLTFAALLPDDGAISVDKDWLDCCEAAGRAALERDASAEQVSGMLGSPGQADTPTDHVDAVWWSEGSLRVPPTRITLSAMPDAATYASMLGASANPGEAVQDVPGEPTWNPPP